jgi:hypothetical protein
VEVRHAASSSDALQGRIAVLVRKRQTLRDHKAPAFVLEENRLAIVQAQLEFAKRLVAEHTDGGSRSREGGAALEAG